MNNSLNTAISNERVMSGEELSASERLMFYDLWAGDRFESGGALWTKLNEQTARRHSSASQMLGTKGYGYIGDSICSFQKNDSIQFIPVA